MPSSAAQSWLWNEAPGNTNWAVPFVQRWEDTLPLRLKQDHPLWQRQMKYYRLAAERLEGKILLRCLDWHMNMDLLAAVRVPERLCMDLVEQPDIIDEAMSSSRQLFPVIWEKIVEAGKMRERGFCKILYCMHGADMLQRDSGALIGPKMFARWVLPELEEEAAPVANVYYHWDGPTQLAHEDVLCSSKSTYTIQYQMRDRRGSPIDYLELYERLQQKGKGIHFWGSPDELKVAHRRLRPERVVYSMSTGSPREADALLSWFEANTQGGT